MDTLDERNQELLEAARSIIRDRYKAGYHHIGAALRTKSGKIFSAVHLETNVGRIAVCAEAIALGMAAAEGDTDIDTIVAVDRKGIVRAPCGMCREMISDYSPNALVIVPGDSEPIIVDVGSLLPNKYFRDIYEDET